MLTGKTRSGFEFKIEDEALDNYELIEAIDETEINPVRIRRVVNLLLGEEQKKALMDHLRNEKGVVTLSAVGDEIIDIFESNKKTKNS